MDLYNYKATELRLGLPGTDDHSPAKIKTTPSLVKNNKRSSPETDSSSVTNEHNESTYPTPTKEQVVGWPPVRCSRKNILQGSTRAGGETVYVKVSMDGAPYLRKVDLKMYRSYGELTKGLQEMFKCITGLYSENERYNNDSEYEPTYEDKDGDWMLVGDVPWEMFVTSCKRLRIMRRSEARGLGVSM